MISNKVRRIYVEKKKGFDVEAQGLYEDLRTNLGVKTLEEVRIIHRYDIADISDETYKKARSTIFSEPPVDNAYDEEIEIDKSAKVFAIEFLPGQYDQRADSAAQCIQILTQGDKPRVRVAKLIVLQGQITDDVYKKIKDYCINPVEAHEATLGKYTTLEVEIVMPEDVAVMTGFIAMDDDALQSFLKEYGFAMDLDDIKCCQGYFRDTEKRDPSITELRMIDTYWSDHCRHTTFLTEIDGVTFEKGKYTDVIENVYQSYIATRNEVYGERQKEKSICLMDIATMGMKELKRQGKLNDLDESEEINACSIQVEIEVDGKQEEWLVMFKNETHNHPTEIEPFGGAATCLGGAIRDPLSGRSYVYQAMRVTGSGDPRTTVEDTIAGKLPQRKITVGAAQGYSSYGNQIGLATGHVAEIYDEGYVAKRMEIGAVIGAAPRSNVVRETPMPGDVIILLGGKTGRDGCGGATGSSKAHTEESLETCGAEVQKGNPPEERKIQRLFRDARVTRMIKRCNDFGAGGVSVAIGELADGLEINLDKVPKKYEGLDGTEIAISESQERMAVVVAKGDAHYFIRKAEKENLEATQVAEVTAKNRLQMQWRGKQIVDISRDFLNTNGAKKNISITVTAPAENHYFDEVATEVTKQGKDIEKAWLTHLKQLNICSQKGLVERFDSTIGAGTVLMPFGGKYQETPAECMVAKLPVLEGETFTGTVMAHGYNPRLSKWSPFHGAVYAVVEAAAKVVAVGGDYRSIRLTLQEYFERLYDDGARWGKPLSALLGAYYAQMKMGIPAIGGKDSMSGSFNDLDVPPTLVAFAVNTVDVRKVTSNEFKQAGSQVVKLPLKQDENQLPDFAYLDKMYTAVHALIQQGKVLTAHTLREGGVSEAISKMCFGNRIGFAFNKEVQAHALFEPAYGSLVLEIPADEKVEGCLDGLIYEVLGETTTHEEIVIGNTTISLDIAVEKWQEPLEKIFPTQAKSPREAVVKGIYDVKKIAPTHTTFVKPRIFIPIFPGTNCEYDTQRAFEKAGGVVNTSVICNLTPKQIEHSIDEMVQYIKQAQIIMIPGGFSAGDEPEGSGKFIATVFRNERVKEAVMQLLNVRGGLMLGICNGFQALIKLGLVPYGEIRDMHTDAPTLTFNTIGRHVSCMVQTKVTSSLSPWFNNVSPGDMHSIAVSHGEGRFVASEELVQSLARNGQIATQYVDMAGNPTYDIQHNPNGSMHAIEGITSLDGRVLGKMGHSERIGNHIVKNVPGEKDQKLFEAGVRYFK